MNETKAIALLKRTAYDMREPLLNHLEDPNNVECQKSDSFSDNGVFKILVSSLGEC